MVKKIIRASVEGQCAGILWALKGTNYLVNQIKTNFPEVEIFAYPIGHNEEIIDWMKRLNIKLVKSINEVPAGSVYLISAHGCSREDRLKAEKRGVIVVDLTCPLVARNHKLIYYAVKKKNVAVIIIGHRNHQEVRGYLGWGNNLLLYCVDSVEAVNKLTLPNYVQQVAIILQTTLSQKDVEAVSEAIKRRFSHLKIFDYQGRCYATINRQNALLQMIKKYDPDTVLVVGDINLSSNTNRLYEIALKEGRNVMSVLNKKFLNKSDFDNSKIIGVTAGASTIPSSVEAVVNQLEEWFKVKAVQDTGILENEHFSEDLFKDELKRIWHKLS